VADVRHGGADGRGQAGRGCPTRCRRGRGNRAGEGGRDSPGPGESRRTRPRRNSATTRSSAVWRLRDALQQRIDGSRVRQGLPVPLADVHAGQLDALTRSRAGPPARRDPGPASNGSPRTTLRRPRGRTCTAGTRRVPLSCTT
jgi:hypothetical protein